jgi:hypothetical protein
LLLNGNKVIKVSRPLEVFFFTAKTRRRGVAERVVEGPLGVPFDKLRDRGVGVSECESEDVGPTSSVRSGMSVETESYGEFESRRDDM